MGLISLEERGHGGFDDKRQRLVPTGGELSQLRHQVRIEVDGETGAHRRNSLIETFIGVDLDQRL